jgi:predicted kinase
MTKRVMILKGLPGCGKSTWAKTEQRRYPGKYKRINKDELRAMLDDGQHSKPNEAFVLKVRDLLITEALATGYSVISDDTNLHPKHETQIRELVKGLGVEVAIKDFTDVPVETCIERDLQREQSVGEKVIRQMYRQFLRPAPVPPAYDPELPDAVICDLDGTLALLNGRDPYDASRCEEDALNKPVAEVLWQMIDVATLLFTSGREERYRPETTRWLASHGFANGPNFLFMRPTGDNRPDAVVKREIYEREILGKYNVLFALDDRNRIVELWRSLGLTCFQVAEGDF